MNTIHLVIITFLLNQGEGWEYVVNRKRATENQFPFFAYLQLHYRGDDYFTGYMFCGATVIHPKWILSAAQCFYPFRYDFGELAHNRTMDVYVGMTNAHMYYYSRTKSVQRVFMHPNYEEVRNLSRLKKAVDDCQYDVAVAIVAEAFALSEYVQLVYLPQFPSNDRCNVGTFIGVGEELHGWHDDFGPKLHYANIAAKSRDQLYRNITAPTVETVFYSEVESHYGHPSEEDVGGPFLCYRNGVAIQYGVISREVSADVYHITAYEAVEKYIGFILKYVPELRIYNAVDFRNPL